MRKIKPRPDLKKIKPLLEDRNYKGGIDGAISPSGNDIVQEACDFHNVKRGMVEKVKWINDDTIILSLHAPYACKLRYERKG